VAILAGGRGTRLGEATASRPKPLVEIGGRPVLWHVLRHFRAHGFREFAVALGYRGECIKRWFLERRLFEGALSVDLARDEAYAETAAPEDWLVHLVDTGERTGTGGRLKRLAPWLGNGSFLAANADGLTTLDLAKLVEFHRAHGRLASVVAVHPPERFGRLVLDGDEVSAFEEKPERGCGWVNGGIYLFEPGVLDYVEDDASMLERGALPALAADRQLVAFRHEGFWRCMDTPADRETLEALWQDGRAPWLAEE
jgi:glucose-1-phosphate cytidylyltransferase